MKALITGSGGLIGSECARVLCREGWEVVGIDNDMWAQFFGHEGTTRPVVEELLATFPHYRHYTLDIRDRQGVCDLLQQARPDCIIHTAAQPSHDKAAAIPYLQSGFRPFATPARWLSQPQLLEVARPVAQWQNSLCNSYPCGAAGGRAAGVGARKCRLCFLSVRTDWATVARGYGCVGLPGEPS